MDINMGMLVDVIDGVQVGVSPLRLPCVRRLALEEGATLPVDPIQVDSEVR